MISDKCSFRDFIEVVKNRDFFEMISLTDQEATNAERLAIKTYGPEEKKYSTCGRYSNKLKSFILYLRHGIKQSNIREHNLERVVSRGQGSSTFAHRVPFHS